MSIVQAAVSRHVLAASLSLCIIVLGILAYSRIDIDRYPDVELPVLSIRTALPGASPLTLAQTVTQPLESRLAGIAGSDRITSSSVSGWSLITATFDVGTDIDTAFSEVQSRLAQARQELPAEAQIPIVQKLAMNAAPVMWMALTGSGTPLEMTEVAKLLKRRLEGIEGVGQIQLIGAAKRILRINLLDSRLAALNVTYADVERAVTENHITLPGGRLLTAGREYQVELPFEYASAQSLRELAITQAGGRIIRLDELAQIEEAPAPTRDLALYQGQASIAIGVYKRPGSHAVELIERVRHHAEHELMPLLPDGATLAIVTDDKKPIEHIVSTLQQHLIEATLLTGLVVWLFLKSLRATTIISSAIPVSLLGALASLYVFGYSLNSFTLLALLLLVGIVIDDAIVVLESIYSTWQAQPDLDPPAAALQGTRMVQSAVMAATLSLVCIFGAVVWLPGMLGQFLQSFAVATVAGVLVSWFVALTLTPMLCSRWLRRPEPKETGMHGKPAGGLGLERPYLTVLTWCLRHRRLVLTAAFLTLLPAGWWLDTMKMEFRPPLNEGKIAIQLTVPAGHGADTIRKLAFKAEAQVAPLDEVASVLTTFEEQQGENGQALHLLITLREQHVASQLRLMEQLQHRFSSMPGWQASVQPATGVHTGKRAGAPLQFHLHGPAPDRLRELAQALHARLTKVPGLQNLGSGAGTMLPQWTAHLDTAALSQLGISSRDVARTIAALNGALVLGRYTAADGERHDIVLGSDAGMVPAGEDVLEQVKVRSRSGALVPLSSLVRFQPTGAAAALQRVDQQYAVSFAGSPRLALGDALQQVRQAASDLPPGYFISFSGQAKEMRHAGSTLLMVFGGALLLLYLVLASLFNHFRQPLLVMLALPLALVGSLGLLAMTGQTLNVYSMIGMVMLVGLAAKNSILLVDKTNQLVRSGMAVDEALRQACPARLRPILMTSLTVVWAMVPAALGFGAGAAHNQPLSIAVIGGMLSSTLLTLVVVPVAYAACFATRRQAEASLSSSLIARAG